MSRRKRLALPARKGQLLSSFLALVCLTTSSCTAPAADKPTAGLTVKATTPLAPGSPTVAGGPYLHQILSASSPDGISWTRDPGVRLEHASVPCAITDGNRIILYYVDADRGTGQPESIACAVSTDGLNFLKQPFKIAGLTTRKALDPSILRDANGQYLLYYLASNATGDPAAETGDHQIQLAVSQDGINFQFNQVVFSYPNLVDPDVFVFQGKWLMYVFSKNQTIIATSDDGRQFTYQQPLALSGWGTVAPVQFDEGRLRLYAFQQCQPSGNLVRSFLSTDGLAWQEEPGDRLAATNDDQITDPFVIRWGNGYKMFFKVEKRPGPNSQSVLPQALPVPGAAGPWDQDVLVFSVNATGQTTNTAIFERAGVPTITRMQDGRLIAAHQFFPAKDPDNFDKVAVHFSSDDGITWTEPQVIHLIGLPEGMRFPFDPTLLVLPDGKIRLYFTSLTGKQFNQDTPAIFSAVSINGLNYTFEPGTRFSLPGRPVIDCAVVLHQGLFHLYAPDNGGQNNPGSNQPTAQAVLSPNPGTGYHAVSTDGLNFTRVDDVKIDNNRTWLGNAHSDGKVITFWGTRQNINPPASVNSQQSGGLWLASSTDGQIWHPSPAPRITGADPGAVASLTGGWLVVVTGPPRPGTPSALRAQVPPMQPGLLPLQLSATPSIVPAEGPRNHRVLLAASLDGLNWQISPPFVIEQASVPELFLGADGQPILFFVDASGTTEPGTLGAMVSGTDSTWVRQRTNLTGADPNVIRVMSGTYRAYTKEKDGNIMVFTSQDGLDWRLQGEAFRDARYPQATDPDVFETPSGWVMLLSLGPRLLRCTSRDGMKFEAGEMLDLGGAVSDTVAVPGGWRTFFHINANPQTGDKMVIRSAFTADGLNWQSEDGVRLVAPASGPAQLGVADPAPLLLANGTWLMAIKSFLK